MSFILITNKVSNFKSKFAHMDQSEEFRSKHADNNRQLSLNNESPSAVFKSKCTCNYRE